MRYDDRAISSSDFILLDRILSHPAMGSPEWRKPSKCDDDVDVRPLSISCRCFIMAVRLDPRPSSRKEVVSVPMRVDLPASTLPTTATRMLREDNVSSTETGLLISSSIMLSPPPPDDLSFFSVSGGVGNVVISSGTA